MAWDLWDSDLCAWLDRQGQRTVCRMTAGTAWAMMGASGSCLDTFVVDLNFRSVFILHSTKSVLLLCSSLIPSRVIPKGCIHWEPFNVLLKFTELSLSRFWPTRLEAAQPWRKYSCDWGFTGGTWLPVCQNGIQNFPLDPLMALPLLYL